MRTFPLLLTVVPFIAAVTGEARAECSMPGSGPGVAQSSTGTGYISPVLLGSAGVGASGYIPPASIGSQAMNAQTAPGNAAVSGYRAAPRSDVPKAAHASGPVISAHTINANSTDYNDVNQLMVHYNPECECMLLNKESETGSGMNLAAALRMISDASLQGGTVPWLASLDYAAENARDASEPYAIYFCNEAASAVTGKGPDVLDAYKKSHDGRAPAPTIFDNGGVLCAFKTAGIALFVKVPLTAENRELAERWSAYDNTLVIVAPSGEKLAAFNREECNEKNVAEFLLGFKEKYKLWQWKAQLSAVREQK